jgi:metallophosphoesterase (TIGR00282 family)
MNLLFIGDVVGSIGRDFLHTKISYLKKKYSPDVLIINGENSADGNGITQQSADDIFSMGADVITTGNHCFQRREGLLIYEQDTVLRPANYPDGNIGKGISYIDFGRYSVAVINLQGTAFLDPLDNPFTKAEELLSGITTKNIIVDFHAESTAEKQAMGYFLAGKVTAVIGTHTHVQTADEKIIDSTAYITDAGMTGPEFSVIGTEIKPALDRFRFRYADKFKEATGQCMINGVYIEFDEKTGKSSKIERVVVR